jgi:hypothetical protein
MSQKILVLGHGRKYQKDNIRCSCYPKDKWFDANYICVDIDAEVEPDILFDLRKKWTFSNDQYDLIIDCGGLVFCGNYSYTDLFKLNVESYLCENGMFYGRKGT